MAMLEYAFVAVRSYFLSVELGSWTACCVFKPFCSAVPISCSISDWCCGTAWGWLARL